MNIHKIIAELQAEKSRLDEAICALERLSAGDKTKRRPKLGKDNPPADPSTDADVTHSRAR
jgi:hypothetical protein